LISGLQHKTKAVRHDCIKTLYEIAERQPKLIAAFANTFIELLGSNDNRMQWGAMTGLSAIVNETPEIIFSNLSKVIAVADVGSVITKDHAVKILVTLSSQKEYVSTTIPLLLEQILASPNNQLPSYAEQAQPVIHDKVAKQRFIQILTDRVGNVTPDSKKKRVEKIIKKLS